MTGAQTSDALKEQREQMNTLIDAMHAKIESLEELNRRLGSAIIKTKTTNELPDDADLCAAAWATSSASDRASFERGWEANAASCRLAHEVIQLRADLAARDAKIAKMQEQFRDYAGRSESDAMELRKEIADLKRGGGGGAGDSAALERFASC